MSTPAGARHVNSEQQQVCCARIGLRTANFRPPLRHGRYTQQNRDSKMNTSRRASNRVSKQRHSLMQPLKQREDHSENHL